MRNKNGVVWHMRGDSAEALLQLHRGGMTVKLSNKVGHRSGPPRDHVSSAVMPISEIDYRLSKSMVFQTPSFSQDNAS